MNVRLLTTLFPRAGTSGAAAAIPAHGHYHV